jgi:putative transposase
MRYRRVRIEGATYFFTVVTHQRRPIFRDPLSVALLDEVIGKIRTWHPFEIDAQVVLPDHLHALWTLPEGDADYSRRWRLIKEAFTRAHVKRQRLRSGWDETSAHQNDQAVWQRRFWEHLIRDERDFATHLDYIHLNPVQHGLTQAPGDWPHSTFSRWVARGTYEPNWGSDSPSELPAWAKRHE